MKIRNGFVSNSSSSSFIFAIAEITDKASLITRFDSFSPDILSFITTKAKLLEQYMYSDNKIYKDLSTGSYEFDLNQLEDDKTYLLLDETGPEGDGYFCDNHYGDMNYDIDAQSNMDAFATFEKEREVTMSDEFIRRMRTSYAALVTQVDDQIGRLITKLKKETIDYFNLGFAFNSSKPLWDIIEKNGYYDEDILEIGLKNHNQKGDIYDFFRNRIIFPIKDAFD